MNDNALEAVPIAVDAVDDAQIPKPVGYHVLIALPEIASTFGDSGIYKTPTAVQHDTILSMIGVVLDMGDLTSFLHCIGTTVSVDQFKATKAASTNDNKRRRSMLLFAKLGAKGGRAIGSSQQHAPNSKQGSPGFLFCPQEKRGVECFC